MYFEQLSPAFGTFVDSVREKKVVVVGHARPDGDCIGCQVALGRVLRAMGAESVCLNQDPVPRRLDFLCPEEFFVKPGEWKPEGHVAVAVDCADPDRPGVAVRDLLAGFDANIDHHISNTGYAGLNLVDSTSAATAEILAGLFLDNGYPIDPITALGLYVGIATDTGQFRFPSTTPRVFEISGRLLHLGADPARASRCLYERESLEKMKLLEAYLSSLRLECGNRVCLGVLPQDVFRKTGAGPDDTEGLVDYARSIDGVDIGVILEDRGVEIKGSFRAKDPRYRVCDLARHFGGGGHDCAAGFTVEMPFDSFYPNLLKVLLEHFREVDSGGDKQETDGGK